MKKAGSMILAFFIMVMSFGGCAGSGTDVESSASVANGTGGTTTIEFWHFFSGGDGETMVKMIDEYNSSQSEYKIVGTTQDWGTYYTKLQTAVMAGEGPDLSVSHHQYVWTLANKGIIVPLDSASKKMGVEIDFENFGPIVEQEKYDDAYYAIPIDLLPVVMFYNKSQCKEAGLLDEDGSLIDFEKGEDGFTEILKKASDARGGKPVLSIPSVGAEPMMIFNTIYYQCGGEGQLIGEDRLTWNMDEKIGVKAFSIYNNLHKYVLKNVEDFNQVFTQGQIPFLFAGAWSLNVIRSGMEEENIGVTTLPILGEKTAFECGGHSFVLPVNENRSDGKQKGCLEFIKWFTHNSDQWAEAGAAPAYEPCQKTDLFSSYPYHKYYQTAFENQSPLTYTAPFNMSGGVAECIEPLSKLTNGETDPQGAYDEMKERMEAACASAK